MQIDRGAPRGDSIAEALAPEAAQLLPILVIKRARSGSTLLMELLGGDALVEQVDALNDFAIRQSIEDWHKIFRQRPKLQLHSGAHSVRP